MAVKGMGSPGKRGREAPVLRQVFLLPVFLLFSGTAPCGDSGTSGENGWFPASVIIPAAGRNPDPRTVAAGIGIRIRKNLQDVRRRLSGELFRIAAGLAAGRPPEFNTAGIGVPGESPVPSGDAERTRDENPRIRRARRLRIRHISGWDSEDEERAGGAAHDVSEKMDEEQDD